MKLSEIKGDRSIEVIADILEQVAIIAADPEAMKFFTEKPKVDKNGNMLEPMEKWVAKRIGEKLPYLLKTHKKALYTIFATLEGVPVDKYIESVTIAKIIKSLVDLFTDESIAPLFTSAQPKEEEK
ncbi:MAG: hypothetical protein IKQ46_10590 [Bacteroidales bacterium]|nr:hypothetical protein [Bacteroidales bacterium]